MLDRHATPRNSCGIVWSCCLHLCGLQDEARCAFQCALHQAATLTSGIPCEGRHAHPEQHKLAKNIPGCGARWRPIP